MRTGALLLALAASGQLVSSFTCLAKSDGEFNGGFWTGFVCLLLCSFIMRKYESYEAFICISISCMTSFASACFSTVVICQELIMVKSTVTCAACDSSTCHYFGSKVILKVTHNLKFLLNIIINEALFISKDIDDELKAQSCYQSEPSYNCNCYISSPADHSNNDDCAN